MMRNVHHHISSAFIRYNRMGYYWYKTIVWDPNRPAFQQHCPAAGRTIRWPSFCLGAWDKAWHPQASEKQTREYVFVQYIYIYIE